ncbi:N-acetylglucosamine-6-phosphate deacetylase [Halorhabdus amylolytica]|uniref:N-acetylglucosamine-6-phosphate deacetylase n=1 Tax=Halorhabdus amylolytica TaxID=2559573 RepID=UPI0010AAAF09|nr:N-acetylglucosamine-6-phosphate deacetylase [Halorhabdus amylolytica]
MAASETLAVGRVLTPHTTIEDAVLAIEDGRIAAIEERVDDADATLSFPDGIAVPGFVDTHVHGYAGHSVCGDPDALVGIAEGVVGTGVTTLFPTTVSESRSVLVAAAEATATAVERDHDGAAVGGLHLEGPYLDPDQRGAQDPDALCDPDVDELRAIADAADGTLSRITLAPELSGAMELVRTARGRDIVVSAGHTAADYDTASRAFDAGVSIATHLYNGMGAFHHREPGILGAALVREDVTAELIADLIHLHPAAIELALAAKGPERCMLVTDAIAATELPDGEYEIGDLDVVVEDGESRLADGTLAGSTLTMDAAVRNLVQSVGVGLPTAVRMASTVPARAMGLQDRGRLAPGLRGDVTVLDPDLRVRATLVDGEVVHERGDD